LSIAPSAVSATATRASAWRAEVSASGSHGILSWDPERLFDHRSGGGGEAALDDVVAVLVEKRRQVAPAVAVGVVTALITGLGELSVRTCDHLELRRRGVAGVVRQGVLGRIGSRPG
jgi:hypothetical protein